MNNEIKEILDRLEYIVFNEIIDYGEELSLNECKLLLDYITNLQQENEIRQQDINNLTYQLAKMKAENERLKELNGNTSKVCMAEHRYGVDKAKEKEDYKYCCEKASEILHNLNDTLPLDLILSEIYYKMEEIKEGKNDIS